MKIILYSGDKILRIIEGAENIEINDKTIKWHDGRLVDIKVDFAIVEDDFQVSEETDISMIQLENKGTENRFKPIEVLQAERIANLESALLTLMDMV